MSPSTIIESASEPELHADSHIPDEPGLSVEIDVAELKRFTLEGT